MISEQPTLTSVTTGIMTDKALLSTIDGVRLNHTMIWSKGNHMDIYQRNQAGMLNAKRQHLPVVDGKGAI